MIKIIAILIPGSVVALLVILVAGIIGIYIRKKLGYSDTQMSEFKSFLVGLPFAIIFIYILLMIHRCSK